MKNTLRNNKKYQRNKNIFKLIHVLKTYSNLILKTYQGIISHKLLINTISHSNKIMDYPNIKHSINHKINRSKICLHNMDQWNNQVIFKITLLLFRLWCIIVIGLFISKKNVRGNV